MRDSDAWTAGQVNSKLWLCNVLEDLQVMRSVPLEPVVYVVGGWVGVLPFLLLSRQRFTVAQVRSFDIDPLATARANEVNNAWIAKSDLAELDSLFWAMTGDASDLDYGLPDVVINTSAEHMASKTWFDRIPGGKVVAIQTTDMAHPDHVINHTCLLDLIDEFPMQSYLFTGEIAFKFSPDMAFKRFMVVGRR